MNSTKYSKIELFAGSVFFKSRRFIFHPDFLVMGPIYRNIKKFSKKYANGTLLDIGCGKKPYKKLFDNNVNEYIGLDHPVTKKTFNTRGIIKPDIYADATKIPLKDDSVDTVIMVQTLEHIKEPEKVIKEINRIMKKEGHIFISVPLMEFEHGQPYDYYRFTRYSLEYLLKKNKFKIVELNLIGSIPSLIAVVINKFLFYDITLFNKYKLIRYFMILLTPLFFIITTILNILTLPFNKSPHMNKYSYLAIVAKKINKYIWGV